LKLDDPGVIGEMDAVKLLHAVAENDNPRTIMGLSIDLDRSHYEVRDLLGQIQNIALEATELRSKVVWA
jgi:hypothetical protein